MAGLSREALPARAALHLAQAGMLLGCWHDQEVVVPPTVAEERTNLQQWTNTLRHELVAAHVLKNAAEGKLKDLQTSYAQERRERLTAVRNSAPESRLYIRFVLFLIVITNNL